MTAKTRRDTVRGEVVSTLPVSPLPPNWDISPFEFCVVKTKLPKHSSISLDKYQTTGTYPIIDQSAEYIAGWTDSVESVIFEDLPVIVFGDHTRVFKYVDFPFAVGADGTKILRANSTILDSFFFYFALLNLNVPSKGYNRHYKYLREFSIAFPIDKSEQRAIAHALRAVQQAQAARRREAALERERKAALMQHLFTRGTRGEPRKQTDIGEMPESWRVVRFANVVEIGKGQVDPKLDPYASMIHVGPENIESDSGRLVATKTNKELKIISGNYLFTAEDILYSKIRPYLNKVALPTFLGTCSADMYPLRPHSDHLIREFLFQFMLSEQFKVRAVSLQDRTGIPKINREQLGSILLLEPPLSEQRDIVAVLRACDAKIAALEREAAILDALFRAMLEELMTGRLLARGLISSFSLGQDP